MQGAITKQTGILMYFRLIMMISNCHHSALILKMDTEFFVVDILSETALRSNRSLVWMNAFSFV